jgi:hypothetical protein
VRLTLRGIERQTIEDSLASIVSELDISEQPGALVVAFKREINDDMLDKALKALAGEGARVLGVESERATLFDVLTAFEQEEEVKK